LLLAAARVGADLVAIRVEEGKGDAVLRLVGQPVVDDDALRWVLARVKH
jgi:hypothetical protein